MVMKMPIDAESSQAFTEVAQSARLCQKILASVGDPAPSSNFDRISEIYPFEKPSDWCRAYLGAAMEHLIMWADYAAPLRFHDEQETIFRLRPAYTLARASIESSAQAVWMLGTQNPMELVRRHLALMNWDLEEHRKSKSDATEKEAVKLRQRKLLERVAGVFEADEIRPPAGYLAVLRDACDSPEVALDPDEVERIWRAASGAAHGKYWPSLDLQHVIPGEEYEPGQFRTVRVPNARGMAEVLRAADTMTTYGVFRFADYSGADLGSLIDDAKRWLATVIPFRSVPMPIPRSSRGSEANQGLVATERFALRRSGLAVC